MTTGSLVKAEGSAPAPVTMQTPMASPHMEPSCSVRFSTCGGGT